MTKEQIKEIAEKVYDDMDELARDIDSYDFGLPMFYSSKDKVMAPLIAALETIEKEIAGGQVAGKSAGADMIAKERAEQIEKHHRTIAHDVERNYMGELVMAAKAILTSEDGQFPAGWDLTIIQKMCDKPYPERVVIAGAFLAAEYDRISADPHWEEELRDEFKAGKLPEQHQADDVRIQELSLMVYSLARVLVRKPCSPVEQKMVEEADEYLRNHFNPADALRQSDVSGEQKGGQP